MTDTLLHTIPQVAAILTCSRPHVYALISSGALHSVDIATPSSGRTKLRIRHQDLVSFLDGVGNGKEPDTPGDHRGAGPQSTT